MRHSLVRFSKEARKVGIVAMEQYFPRTFISQVIFFFFFDLLAVLAVCWRCWKWGCFSHERNQL